MTGNQIAYWQLQETKRSNLINEGLKSENLQETKRSNMRNEDIKEDTHDETKLNNKHNRVIGYINASANVIKSAGSLANPLNMLFKS
uniref:Uncharacterized protein n=1 Tax=Dromedary picobirnavirus TaxID=1574421 RepID=A0A3G9E2R8_9VIRU|nr:hypothetical protein [Dromedary picobirnavirus]